MTTMDLSATFLSFKKPGSIDGLLHEEESHREIMEDISRSCFDKTPSFDHEEFHPVSMHAFQDTHESGLELSHTVKPKVAKQKQWDIYSMSTHIKSCMNVNWTL